MGGDDDCDESLGIYFVRRTQMTYKTKEKKTMKQYQYQADFPWKTKKSFVLHHLCSVHEVWLELGIY